MEDTSEGEPAAFFCGGNTSSELLEVLSHAT